MSASKNLLVAILILLCGGASAFAQQGGATGGNPPTEIRRAGSKLSIDSGGNAYFDLMTGKVVTLNNTCSGAAVSASGKASYCYDNTSHTVKLSVNGGAYSAIMTAATVPAASPVDATYLTQTPNATLTNEQPMSALATGLVKNTTTTGVQSIAVAGTDYESPLTFSAPLSRSVNAVSVNSNLIDNSIAYCADAGASDTYACSLTPAPGSYVTGARYRFKANTANTGAATLNLNALGAKTIKKATGGVTTDLADNDIRAGQVVDVVYDGTNLQMQSLLGNAPSNAVSKTSSRINSLAKFTGTNDIGVSQIEDDGTDIIATVGAGNVTFNSIGIISFGDIDGNGSGTFASIDDTASTIRLNATILSLTSTRIQVPCVITPTGTTGNQSINSQCGSVNFAATATALAVNSPSISTSNLIICTVGTNDATLKSVQCVAGTGSFVIYANTAATAETQVNFWVLTPLP